MSDLRRGMLLYAETLFLCSETETVLDIVRNFPDGGKIDSNVTD
jgi:hypothetical protein